MVNKKDGFTIVEVTITLAIGALLITLLTQSYSGTVMRQQGLQQR